MRGRLRRYPQFRELERIAFYDPREFVQWERRPKFDEDQQLIGFEDVMIVTPSRKLTGDQAAAVRSVTTKSGCLKFETHDKLGALEKLAKVLGLYVEAPQAVNVNQTLNQLNISGDNSLEAARRLAFALEKVRQISKAEPLTIEHEPSGEPKA
jgi:hypothetical protein